MSGVLHVVIAEADPLVCQELAKSLTEKPHLIAHPATGSPMEALDRCREHHRCVLVMGESDLERIDGDLFTQRVDCGRGVPVVVLGAGPVEEGTARCLRLGCMGYLSCTDSLATLRKAVHAVAAGQMWAPRGVLTRLLQESRAEPDSRPLLTSREREILALIHAGDSNSQIACKLFVSCETVRWHVRRLLAKIGARDRAAAVEFARRRRIWGRERRLLAPVPFPAPVAGVRHHGPGSGCAQSHDAQKAGRLV